MTPAKALCGFGCSGTTSFWVSPHASLGSLPFPNFCMQATSWHPTMTLRMPSSASSTPERQAWGARPKTSVRLDDGGLAIAKFPHAGDSWDVMAWEATALDLLEAAGVRTPSHRLAQVGDRSVLLLRRFDRATGDERLGYFSAMTAIGSSDGEQRDYADIAETVRASRLLQCKISTSSMTESSQISLSATPTIICATTVSLPVAACGGSARPST